jgi:hypothetical protein
MGLKPAPWVLLLGLTLASGCGSGSARTEAPAGTAASAETDAPLIPAGLTRAQYHDKVLGLLVGSAMGDAMGAPTEMWSRTDIQIEYGHVTGLDSMVRSPSGEGTWRYNLPAGGTTDDTRWKQLAAQFVLSQDWQRPDPRAFARFLEKQYGAQIDGLRKTEGYDADAFDEAALRVGWLQEWARVAQPYADRDFDGYHEALSRFYGGEPTCAGLLYGPLLGVCTPANPARGYELGYRLSLFDLGYARDLTALSAAFTAAAFTPGAMPETLLGTVRDVDPRGYYRSRLVGRTAYRLLRQARGIVAESQGLTRADVPPTFRLPPAFRQRFDTLGYLRLQRAYERLDALNQDLPFHPGECFLIAVTAMLHSEFDYERTMAFIVNYGRDNDTVAAIAGAWLGAYHGAARLPQAEVARVVRVNREQLGIDLPRLAEQLTAKLYGPEP